MSVDASADVSRSGPATGALGPGRTTAHADLLVVDDEPPVRRSFVAILKSSGYRVSEAESAFDGLHILRQQRVDLVVLDLRMPGLSGLSFLSIGHLEGTMPRTVVISGFLTPDAIDAVQRLGAAAVLHKPVRNTELVAAVRAALAAPAPFRVQPVAATAVDRWSHRAALACVARTDFSSIGEWARIVATSEGSLRESCHLVDLPARDARDFVRIVRAIVEASGTGTPPEFLLKVSDERTLRALKERSGFAKTGLPRTVLGFFQQQTLLRSDHPAVVRLRRILVQDV